MSGLGAVDKLTCDRRSCTSTDQPPRVPLLVLIRVDGCGVQLFGFLGPLAKRSVGGLPAGPGAGVVGGAPGSACGPEPGSSDTRTELATREDGTTVVQRRLGRRLPLSPAVSSRLAAGRISHRSGRGLSGQRLPPRRRPWTPLSLAQVVHDPADDPRLGDEGNDPHLGSTARTHQRVCLVRPPDQVRPPAPQRRPFRRRGDGLLDLAGAAGLEPVLRLSALPPGAVRLGPVVAHHVPSRLRDLDQNPSHEVFGVDSVVFPWL
jgi:hypothetical protein